MRSIAVASSIVTCMIRRPVAIPGESRPGPGRLMNEKVLLIIGQHRHRACWREFPNRISIAVISGLTKPASGRMRNTSSRMLALAILLMSVALCVLPSQVDVSAEETRQTPLANVYESEIRPLLRRYCHKCHGGGDTIEGDVNLAAMKSWGDAAGQPETWRLVAEMLANRLMPPEEAEQPTEVDRSRLLDWVNRLSCDRRRGAFRRSRASHPSPPEQCGVYLHAARFDGHRVARPGS